MNISIAFHLINSSIQQYIHIAYKLIIRSIIRIVITIADNNFVLLLSKSSINFSFLAVAFLYSIAMVIISIVYVSWDFFLSHFFLIEKLVLSYALSLLW